LRIQQPKPAADDAPPEKGPRKRGKRPGKPRTAKMKREKKAAARAKEAAAEEEAEGEEGGAEEKEERSGPSAKERGRSKAVGGDGKEVAPEEEDKYLDSRVFVRGLPPGTDEKAVRKIFAGKGDIRSVKLVVNTRGEFRGCAFVTFSTEAHAMAALDLDGSEFKERELTVKKAAPPVKAPNLQVFLGGLPFNADEKTLRKDFSECGKIAKFRMLSNPKTGKFKGSAFVTYEDQKGVDAALKYDGTEYGGRNLVCRLADPKGTNQRDKDGGGAGKGNDGDDGRRKAGEADVETTAAGKAAESGKQGKKRPRGKSEGEAEEEGPASKKGKRPKARSGGKPSGEGPEKGKKKKNGDKKKAKAAGGEGGEE